MFIRGYIFSFLFGASIVSAAPSKFFANDEIQKKAPAGFALQPESAQFVRQLLATTEVHRRQLAQMILADQELKSALQKWEQLSIDEQIPYLKKIFHLETTLLGIQPPELVIGKKVTPGAAYFDFDVKKPGAGKVFLNTEVLAKEKSKYVALSLLLHETRHSFQFQMAYSQPALDQTLGVLAAGYRAAFEAQSSLSGQLSFCDFLTLLNEYEAFQFGNDVLRRLTDGAVDLADMGTYASQFDAQGKLKIDLVALLDAFGESMLLGKFNELEQAQYDLLMMDTSANNP